MYKQITVYWNYGLDGNSIATVSNNAPDVESLLEASFESDDIMNHDFGAICVTQILYH